jgi:hypothetical protein
MGKPKQRFLSIHIFVLKINQKLKERKALGQVFPENFDFPCQSTFHLLLHNHFHYHPRLAQ